VSIETEIFNQELDRVEAQAKEIRDYIEWLNSGKAATANGTVYSKKRIADGLARGKEQLAAYEAMIKAIRGLIQGKAANMTAETRAIARRAIEECQHRGYGDDSTTDYLASDLALYAKLGGQAASDLAYEIVHKLKCRI